MSVAATIGAIGATAGGTIGAVGASKAAGAQAGAARSAAELQHEDQMAALAENQRQFNLTQENIAPWLAAGKGGLAQLVALLSTPGKGLLTPWTDTFHAPTAAEAAATPGFQFELGQGENAIQNSAAASGNLLSTGTAKSLSGFAENLASTDYQATYNRALTEYQQAYNIFQGNQTNTFNRLAALAGVGQNAATTLSSVGQASANNAASILLTGGAQQGANLNLAGAANASGYAGVANALTGGINNAYQALLLQALYGGGMPGTGSGPVTGQESTPGGI